MSLFNNFTDEQLKHLDTVKSIRLCKKNDILFQQGDEVSGIFCITDGLLKVIQKNSDNKVVFSRLAFPGDTVGHRSIFIEDRFKGTCTVMSDAAEICFLPKETVLKLFSNNHEFAKSLITKISAELERSVQDHIVLNEKTSFSRLCVLLLNLFEKHSELKDGRKTVKTAISKVDLARLLSVADETVIRWMSDLQKEEVVTSSDKKFILLNEEKLKRYSQN